MLKRLKYGIAFGLGAVAGGLGAFWLQEVHYTRTLDLWDVISDSATLKRDVLMFSSAETEIPCIAAKLASARSKAVANDSRSRLPAPFFELGELPSFAQDAAVEVLESYRNSSLPDRYVECTRGQDSHN